MKRTFIPLGLFLVFLLIWSCEKPTNPIEEGPLEFNVDTLKFDSIFTTFLTPSERLIVRNPKDRAISISRIWLESGDKTEFSMIVDGIQSNDVSDVVIAKNDSLHIFVNLKSELKDDFKEEYIAFEIGGEIQRMLIRAFVLDAYFLTARITQEGNSLSLQEGSYIFRNDTVLTPDKPIIMDGPLFILPGVTVTVLPGTQLYFTPYKFGIKDSNGVPVFALYSMLFVDGTLQAEGTADEPIVFAGSRLDEDYSENPAQWRGINFRKESRDNILRHCEIKNGLIGIQVDSLSLTQNPKLTIQNSEIKNMGAHGIVGLGFDASGTAGNVPPSIFMENSIVNSCKERTLLVLGGGNYDFYNCTFANFSIARFSRRTPQVLLGNWFSFDGSTANVYPAFIDMVNCLIWGSEEDEIVLDTLEAAPFTSLVLDHSMVKTSDDYSPAILPHLKASFRNLDPLFNDFSNRDYRLKLNSPAINSGIDFPAGSSGYEDDFRGRIDSLRYDGFDIGAYEYYPIEE